MLKNIKAAIPFLLAVLLTAPLLPGCGKKKQETASPAPANTSAQPAQSQKMSFDELMARAHVEEAYFTGLCRLLMTRQILLALDNPEALKDGQKPTQVQIKILPPNEISKKGSALIFSGTGALAQAGQQLNWTKNEKGMYSYAALTGQALFSALQSNGYDAAVLDIVSPSAHAFGPEDIKTLAEGNIPDFKAPAAAVPEKKAAAPVPKKTAAAATPAKKADAK